MLQSLKSVRFPQESGYYFWYIHDLSWFEIGSCHVMKDSEKHLAYLKKQKEDGKDFNFYIYQNDKGEILTMYFEACRGKPEDSHAPPRDAETGVPCVDGFIPFDFNELLDKTLK